MKTNHKNPRRSFLTTLASGAAFIGVGSYLPPKSDKSGNGNGNLLHALNNNPSDPDEWFNQIKGKHRMVFDATRPHELFPFAWPKVFLLTNLKTGTPFDQSSVVVVLRHDAICYAFESSLWEKYHFGDVFKAMDPKTKNPSSRNPFWQPAADDFKIPGLGAVAIGINNLQADGVMFCVCEMAINVFTSVVADRMQMKAEEVKKDWIAGLLPGIQLVPSGVWAVGRAQEHGCAYCFAG